MSEHTPLHLGSKHAATLTVVGSAAVATLWLTGPFAPAPPIASPHRLGTWWDAAGPIDIAASGARAVGLVLGSYLAVLGVCGALAAALPPAATATRWLIRPLGRRVIVGGGMAVAISVPTIGVADDTPHNSLEQSPSGFHLVDLGPDPNHPTASTPQANSHEVSDHPAQLNEHSQPGGETWLVAPGDHLWHIAEETVVERGGKDDEATVALYWRELIELNRDVIGPDEDLIHPGLVLELPD